MVMNFNDAEQDKFGENTQYAKPDLIPDKTMSAMKIHLIDPSDGDKPERIVPGVPYLNLSKRDGLTQYLVLNLELLNGEHKGRRFYHNFTTSTPNLENPAKNITMKALRSIIESALGIDPNDDSPEAMAKRDMSAHKDWGFLHGIQFVGAVKVEKGNKKNNGSNPPEFWDDSNKLSYALTAKNGEEYYKHAAVFGLTPNSPVAPTAPVAPVAPAAPVAPIATPAFSPDTDRVVEAAPVAPAPVAPAAPVSQPVTSDRPDWLNQ